MLDTGGQLRQLTAVRGMDLFNRDDRPGSSIIEKFQKVFPERPPGNLPLRKELGGDTESAAAMAVIRRAWKPGPITSASFRMDSPIRPMKPSVAVSEITATPAPEQGRGRPPA